MKKNKRYSYSGRFSEDTTYVGKHSVPKKIKSKFDEFRTTVGDDNSFRKKFRNAVEDYKRGVRKVGKNSTNHYHFNFTLLILVFFLI